MTIIDELCLPPALRKEQPKRTNYPPNLKMGTQPIPCELIYKNNSYEIKIAIPSTAESYGLQEDGQDGLDIVEEMNVSPSRFLTLNLGERIQFGVPGP